MKKCNKGYSLVELLVALAIFSLVMVGIVTIMRSTSASYKSGIEEATVQEEVQIASNQISDILIDARDIITTSNPYKFKDANSDTIALQYVSADKQVKLIAADGSTHILADNVTTFSISGLRKEQNADNVCVLNLGMTYQGASYSSKKEICFRNNIEDKDFNDIVHVSGGAATPMSGYKAEVEIRRYEAFDASAAYDIVSDAVLSASCSGKYELVETTNPHISGKSQYQVVLNNAYKMAFNDRIAKSEKCELVGKNSSGTEVKLLLYTEKVEFAGTDNIYVVNYNNTTNAGYGTYMDVKGINMNEACKAVTVTCSTELYDGSNTYSNGTYTLNSKTDCKDMKPNCGGNYNGAGGNLDFVAMGLVPDPNSAGMMITKANDALNVKSAAASKFYNNKKSTITFKLNINGYSYTIVYKFYIEGSDVLAQL